MGFIKDRSLLQYQKQIITENKNFDVEAIISIWNEIASLNPNIQKITKHNKTVRKLIRRELRRGKLKTKDDWNRFFDEIEKIHSVYWGLSKKASHNWLSLQSILSPPVKIYEGDKRILDKILEGKYRTIKRRK